MCGIAGIIGGNVKENEFKLDLMLNIQNHRGPDYTGKYIENDFVLGHNRLSIIDLNPQSNQPMVSACGKYIIVFNGEIYNYKELKEMLIYPYKTNGDTEVLLAAYIKWGENCLEFLNGMFAFGIYDIGKKQLFAARDRFGVKPLFFAQTKDQFVFASEIKTILSTEIVNRNWNEKTWANYLAFGQYAELSNTFYQNIFQLPASSKLIYKEGKLQIDKYYNFEEKISNYDWSNVVLNEVKGKLLETLESSIKYRLIADVKKGFNMSGGMDSTLLFELIKKELNPDLTEAFTFYTNNINYDELNWVNQILKGSKIPLNKCLLDVNEVPNFAEKIQYYQDEPYSGIATLAYAKTFEKARENGVVVVLDGSGMDELVGGYDYYSNNTNNIIQGLTSEPFRINALNKELLKLASKTKPEKIFKSKLQNLQFRDIFRTKLPRDLRMTDRISMAFGVEMREPFLDHRLVEIGFSLPDELKIQQNQTKWIMRQVLKGYVNKSIAEAPKRPIQTPQREWLSNELKLWVMDMIKIAIDKTNLLDKKEVLKEVDNFMKNDNSNSFYIWQWVNIGLMCNKI
jgi:asparagine synthase (glutamine-hydrolysing)